MILGLPLLTHFASSRASMLGLGLTLGALLGNSGEMVAVGYVTDFIPFPPGWLCSPADLCLDAGLILLLLGLYLDAAQRVRARRKQLAEAS